LTLSALFLFSNAALLKCLSSTTASSVSPIFL
jgi:hypothetical protein